MQFRTAMATQRHSGNFAHMRLHDENDTGAKPGNSGVLGQSGAFLFLGVLLSIATLSTFRIGGCHLRKRSCRRSAAYGGSEL